MSSKKRPSVALNYLYNLIYQILSFILPFVVTPYVSRTLRAEAIGAYSYCSSVATYFSLISILGLNLYGQLAISKCRDRREELTNTFWGIFTAKAVTTVFSIALYTLVIFFNSNYRSIYLALSLILFSNIIDITWLYQGIEQFNKIVLRNVVVKMLSLLLIFIYIKNETDVVRYALILNGSTFVANVSLWMNIRKYIDKYSVRDKCWVQHIKRAFPYFIPTLASSIYTVLDKSMLGWIGTSNYENGIYEQTHKIVLATATIISALSTVLLPRMSFLFSQNKTEEFKDYLYKVLRAVGIISLPIAFGLFSVADSFIPIFLGDGFEKCIILLKLFCPLVFFSGLNNIIGSQCLIAKNKQSQYNICVICGALTNVVLNALFISRLLSVGAVIASVSAEGVILILFICYTKNDIDIKTMFLSWTKPLIASIGMLFVVKLSALIFKEVIISLLAQVVFGGVSYLIILCVMRESITIGFLNTVYRKITGK